MEENSHCFPYIFITNVDFEYANSHWSRVGVDVVQLSPEEAKNKPDLDTTKSHVSNNNKKRSDIHKERSRSLCNTTNTTPLIKHTHKKKPKPVPGRPPPGSCFDPHCADSPLFVRSVVIVELQLSRVRRALAARCIPQIASNTPKKKEKIGRTRTITLQKVQKKRL